MATVCVTRRKRQKSPKYPSGYAYQVRFRTGGRYTVVQDGGTFPLLRYANERANLVRVELAAGRDPGASIAALEAPAPQRVGLAEWWARFEEHRSNLDPATIRSYVSARSALVPLLGARTDPRALTVAGVQDALDEAHTGGLAAGTLRKYLGTLKMVLDYCEVEPNPARSPRLRPPRVVREQIAPPSAAEVQAILAHVKAPSTVKLLTDADLVLLFTLTECLGLRLREVLGLRLEDVDADRGRIRVYGKREASAQLKPRWLPVPEELLEGIVAKAESGPADRPVFAGVTGGQLRRVMAKACVAANIEHRHPHELRHRRISLWLDYEFQPVAVAEWAGHSKASMSTDVYGHVLVSGDDPWRLFWHTAYNRMRGLPMLRPAEEDAA